MKITTLSDWSRNIQSNVHNIVSHSGSKNSYARYYTDSSMLYFFDNGEENPSVAKIIAHDGISKKGPFAKMRFFNKYYSRQFGWERQKFEAAFSKLYPKTGDLRTKLINEGRIALDRIKPKASKLEKFLMFTKL